MRKTYLLAIFIFAVVFFANSSATKAQAPEQIDIRSLHVTYQNHWTDGLFTMNALNSAGQVVTYGGTGTFVFNCDPCNIPNTFDTNKFQRPDIVPGGGFAFRWGFDRFVRFYVPTASSSTIIISPRHTWKQRYITVNGTTTIYGRVEVTDNVGRLIAVASDVSLQGSFTARFLLSNLYPNGRKISFTQIDYSLAKP